MLYIEKSDEPLFLSDFKRRNPTQTYDSEEFAKWRIELKKVLIKEQKGLCAYCCGKITEEKSHNEHIEPRNPGIYSSDNSLEYTNIVASCNNQETCGNKKKNKYDSMRFVSPLDKDCEEKFTYYADGVIGGDPYTIDLLNLNDYGLKSARKAVFRKLMNLDKDTIKECYMNESEENLQPYHNVIKWILKTM